MTTRLLPHCPNTTRPLPDTSEATPHASMSLPTSIFLVLSYTSIMVASSRTDASPVPSFTVPTIHAGCPSNVCSSLTKLWEQNKER